MLKKYCNIYLKGVDSTNNLNNNYVNLDCIPKKKGIGKYKDVDVFDWNKSVGLEIDIFYNSKIRSVKIINYNAKTKKITLSYKGNIEDVRVDHFKNCNLGKLFMEVTNKFKYDVNQIIKSIDIKIINREYRENPHNKGKFLKWYKYHCNKCGWDEGWIEESNLNKGIGCSCCSGRTIVQGINSIYDTHKWLICDFGLDEEFAKTHTYGTSQKGVFICKNCGTAKRKLVSSVIYEKSIGCNVCGDGVTYPEKFMCNVLMQLGIEFETQYSPHYLKQKKSDFYLSNYSLIIETDGMLGHKGGKVHGKSNKTLEECIKIDRWKEEQHRLHGIDTIRINCFESDMEYIKNNIINSRLNELLDLSKVDWIQADLYAIKSSKKREAWDIFNLNRKSMTMLEMSKRLNISYPTFLKYLKDGAKINKCHYGLEV